MQIKTRLLTIAGLASRLNLTRGEITSMVKRKEIPHVELPDGQVRFDEADVANWLEELKTKGTAKS